MLVAPRYSGIEIPVHDPDVPVATSTQLKQPSKFQREIAQAGAPTFLRAALIELLDSEHAPGSLAELLEKTDEELDAVAELCDAEVVGHEWGLYPVKGKGYDYEYLRYLPSFSGVYGLEGMPAGHILVAEVELVCDPEPEATRGSMGEHLSVIKSGLNRYYGEGKGSYQLSDMRWSGRYYRPDQFVVGATAGSGAGQAGRKLVDIEPRFRLTR